MANRSTFKGLSRAVRGSAAALVASLVVLAGSAQAWAVSLVKDGKPVARIVISKEAFDAPLYKPRMLAQAKPAEKIKLAATDLQTYIQKMTGAKLEIVSDEAAVGGPVVLVGESKMTAPLKLNIPSGMTPERREEGFIMQAKGDTLVLVGNDTGPYQGTYFSVADFLKRHGVRWFMPSEFGEIVPKHQTIDVADFEVIEKPDFHVRAWNGNLAPELAEADAIWRLRNKATLDFNNVICIPGDSWLRKYMPDKELLTTKPELFAMQLNGKPDPHMINLTNPESVKIVADKVKAEIKLKREKDPTFNSLGFAPDDGIPMDHTPATMKTNLGFTDLVGREGVVTELSVSEEWFRFMNKVTEEVVKEYPGFVITTNGYTNRTFPPEGVEIHPQMGIMFAAIWADLLHSFDDPKSWQQNLQGQMLKRWAELSPRVFVYNYNFPMLVNLLTPLPLTRKIARNTKMMKDWGIYGFEDEQTFSWMAHGITAFYLRPQLYWDADADANAILKDYFEKWYGPAAKPSQAYWDAIEEALESTQMLGHEDRVLPYVYTDKMIASMEKSQQESEKLATAEPYKTRVRVDRLILDHLKGYMALNRAEFVGNYPEAIKQADKMFENRMELNKISGYFHIPETKDPRRKYFAGSHYWNLTQRKEFYEKNLAKINGTTGDLIVQAPRELTFSIDDADLGRISRWYMPDFDRSKWRKIDTATPFYLQDKKWLDERGVPYTGYMWYVFEFDLTAAQAAKPVSVLAPIVATEAWVWTNGQFSGHRQYVEAYIRPQSVEFDISSQVKPGKNVVAFRVSTSASRIQVAEGFQGPLFIYSPKPVPPAAAVEKK